MTCASWENRKGQKILHLPFRGIRQNHERTYNVQLALVVGTAVATQKHASMNGQKLMVVQPQLAHGTGPDGDPQIAVDGIGAGPGQQVMITSDGRGAREIVGDDTTPVRWTIIGIRDDR